MLLGITATSCTGSGTADTTHKFLSLSLSENESTVVLQPNVPEREQGLAFI